MEVRGVSQGGQTSFDTSSFGSSEVKNLTAVANTNVNKTTDISEKPVDEKEVKKAVDKLNKFLEDDQVRVEYEVHSKFKDIMIKIVDKDTGDVISEVPPKKILDMVARLCELVGVVFDKKA